jgi:hypothetical protein
VGIGGLWMRKLLLYSIAVLSLVVVVFNNLSQVIERLAFDNFDYRVWLSFLMITLGVVWYGIVNKNMFKL